MGISNLVNATQGDSTRSQSRLAKTGRQRTFVLGQQEDKKIENSEETSKVSTKNEPMPSTSKQDFSTDNNLLNDNLFNRQTRSSNENLSSLKPAIYDENRSHQFSSNIRNRLKSRFKRISVDEDAIKKKEEHKEFNQIKNKVDNRLDKTYSWKNKLICIVTGKDKVDNNLITYQNEYYFFTKQGKTIKQPNKLENLLNNQLRSYLEGNHNLYYPSLNKANIVLAYPNLNKQIKDFINQNNLPLFKKFTQRILIEKNENLEQKHLDLILDSKKSFFELSTNLEDLKEEFDNQNTIDQQRKSSLKDQTEEQPEIQTSTNSTISIKEEFVLESIDLRFLKHKHSTKEMNLASEIISNFEFIDELTSNECINKLTTKIEKLKEVIDLIENCVQEYQTKLTNTEQVSSNELIQKTSFNLIKNYLNFMNFLYIERDKLVQELRIKLFNLLKNWKELTVLRQNISNSKATLTLHFREHLEQFDKDEKAELNFLIEERLEFERKFANFKVTTHLNQRIRSMFNRLINKSESNENLISDNQSEDDETYFLNIKNKAILLDGRLPDEPSFFDFNLTFENNQNLNEDVNENVNQDVNQDTNQQNINKLKLRKYLLQIYNNNKMIYQSNDYELDQNLQIKFTDIQFKEKFRDNLQFDKYIICHLIEMKKNKKKLLSKLELNIQQIIIQSQLYNNTKFGIKAHFATKLSNGELVLNFKKISDQIDRLADENSIEQISSDFTNLIMIKYDFNNSKANSKFEFTSKDELKNKLYFVIKMKNEVYNQKELNNLLSIIKRNYRTEQVKDQINNQDKSIRNELYNLFDQNKKVELNQRLVLLKQRNEDEELSKQRIPLYDSHYLSFLIKDKEQINAKSNYLPIELNQTNLNVDLLRAYDNKRKTVIDYLIDVRKKFINQSNSWNKNFKNYEDYVYEEIDTSLSTLNFDFLFFRKESKRPLRPNRKERKKYQQSLIQQLNSKTSTNGQSTSQNDKVKIMINVIQGQNIPVRKSPLTNQIKDTTDEISSSQQQLTPNYANFTKRLNELFYDEMHSYNSLDSVISKNIAIDLSLKERKVNSFIEITFQNQTAQTLPAESSQPSWNSTIKLDLNVPNDDYSPNNLLKIDDFIDLNLYDHVEVIKENELDLERKFDTAPKKYVKNWLGSISIPFITLYLNGKIEGMFCVQKPTYLTNYDFETKPTFSLLASGGHNQDLIIDSSYLNNLDSKKNSYLSLYLTIDPQLNLPSKIEFKCSTDEETVIYNYAKDWQSQLNKKYPNRLIKSLVINLVNGKHTLVNRFLSPLEPPVEFLNTGQFNETNKDYKNVLMKNLARYVSLIPMISSELASIGLIEEIWSDSEQFLKLNLGGVEEHAILLCNYFLYLGLNCGLVLGNGVPEGKTMYVIVWLNDLTMKDDNYLNVQLWNAITGQCYFVHTDNFLPLSSTDCIVTRDNVYANIQKEVQSNQISFNILKKNHWKPLFNLGNLKVKLKSIQPDKIEYEAVNENYVRNLEQQIEVYLKESLMKWRRQKKTFFNRFCTKEIKRELSQMEYKVCHMKEIDPNEEINKILSTYKIDGIELNLPFNGINSLAKLIYSTGLHLNTDDKVDFVIAVHLHGYSQNVFSTWIYCAQIRGR